MTSSKPFALPCLSLLIFLCYVVPSPLSPRLQRSRHSLQNTIRSVDGTLVCNAAIRYQTLLTLLQFLILAFLSAHDKHDCYTVATTSLYLALLLASSPLSSGPPPFKQCSVPSRSSHLERRQLFSLGPSLPAPASSSQRPQSHSFSNSTSTTTLHWLTPYSLLEHYLTTTFLLRTNTPSTATIDHPRYAFNYYYYHHH